MIKNRHTIDIDMDDSRAGIIPFIKINDTIKMMFMVPSDPIYGGNRPQIAKGGIEWDISSDGQSYHSALKEGEEELGLLEKNINSVELVAIYRWGKSTLTLYCAEIIDINDFAEPHYETRETCWLTLDDYKKIGRKEQLHMVEQTYELIQKWSKI